MMANILLAAMMAVFVAAFAWEVVRRKRRAAPRSWFSRVVDEFRRGFMEGFRPERAAAPVAAT